MHSTGSNDSAPVNRILERAVSSLMAIAAIGGLAAVLGACSRTSPAAGAEEKAVARVPGKKCVVHLHGKSGNGAPPTQIADTTHLRPSGNASGWGGRQWLYFSEDEYRTVQGVVSRSVASHGCDKVIVHGFSNGAAAAAKLFCRGERFDDRVVGYVIDDPVVDHAVERCKPPKNVHVRLYWTGALANSVDGWVCSRSDWTCEGGSTIGIEKYSAALGTATTQSVHHTHEEYAAPPDYAAWFGP